MTKVYIWSMKVQRKVIEAMKSDWKDCYFEVINEHEIAFDDEKDARNLVYILTKETHHRAKIIEN